MLNVASIFLFSYLILLYNSINIPLFTIRIMLMIFLLSRSIKSSLVVIMVFVSAQTRNRRNLSTYIVAIVTQKEAVDGIHTPGKCTKANIYRETIHTTSLLVCRTKQKCSMFKSAPLGKNAVSAFQISCKLLSFTLKDS